DPLSPGEVLRLAASPDASARLVRHRAGRWSAEHGPFQPAVFSRLPRRDWTVLVQDTNHFSPRAAALLARFDFIAHARVDDVMVSYAVPGLPLKVLAAFRPEQEWVLEAGDMLYLPPGVAHEGVAQTECLTWSIGFRAPTDRELVAGFLDYLHEKLDPRGQYADAGARPARHPGEIPRELTAHVGRALAGIRWTAADVREFTGRFLSEP